MTDGLVESTTPETSTESKAADAQEKLLPQSEVNKLVGGAKNSAYQKGYQAAQAELLKQQSAQPQESEPESNVPNSANTFGGMQQLAPEDLSQAVAAEIQRLEQVRQEEAQKQQREAYVQQTISELSHKVNDAKSRYPDFDEVTGQLDFTQMPEVLELANTADNAGDVLYELAKNPEKIAPLRSVPPTAAVTLVKKLSDSIKQNQTGSQANLPKEPLSHVQPSSVGRDSGSMGIKDYKRLYRG